MNERHVYSRDQLLTGRWTLPTLPSDVKQKVCVLGIRRRVRGTRAGRKVARLQPRPIPVRCTASRDRSNVCKHYDQLIPSTSTLQEPLRSRRNLLRVPLDIVGGLQLANGSESLPLSTCVWASIPELRWAQSTGPLDEVSMASEYEKNLLHQYNSLFHRRRSLVTWRQRRQRDSLSTGALSPIISRDRMASDQLIIFTGSDHPVQCTSTLSMSQPATTDGGDSVQCLPSTVL